MKVIQLSIPTIKIYKCHDDTFSIIFYELYLNGKYEGRYQSISDIHWRLGLILTEASLTTEV